MTERRKGTAEIRGWPRWSERLADRLDRLPGVPTRLQPPWRALLDRVGMPRPGQLATLTDLSLPVVPLPIWEAQRLRRLGHRVPKRAVEDAVVATACGYLAVRLQDDRLDECKGDEAVAHLLASTLLLEHSRLLLGLAPGIGPHMCAAWSQYAQAMDLEHRHLGSWSDADWHASLGRFAPLGLAAKALLVQAGRLGDLAELDFVLVQLCEGHQIWEDTTDLQSDLAAGRATWVADQLDLRHHCDAAEGALLAGGLAWARDRAAGLLGSARQACGNRPELAAHVDRRSAAMDSAVNLWIRDLAHHLALVAQSDIVLSS